MELIGFGVVELAGEEDIQVIPLKPNPVPVKASPLGIMGQHHTLQPNDTVLLLRDTNGYIYALPITFTPNRIPNTFKYTDPSATSALTLRPAATSLEAAGRAGMMVDGLQGLLQAYAPVLYMLWQLGNLQFNDAGLTLKLNQQPEDAKQQPVTITIKPEAITLVIEGDNQQTTLTITPEDTTLDVQNTRLHITDGRVTLELDDNNTLQWDGDKWRLQTPKLVVKANDINLGDGNLTPTDGVLTANTLPTCPFTGIPMVNVASKTVKAKK